MNVQDLREALVLLRGDLPVVLRVQDEGRNAYESAPLLIAETSRHDGTLRLYLWGSRAGYTHARGFPSFGPPTLCGEGQPSDEVPAEITCPKCNAILGGGVAALAERIGELEAEGWSVGSAPPKKEKTQ